LKWDEGAAVESEVVFVLCKLELCVYSSKDRISMFPPTFT